MPILPSGRRVEFSLDRFHVLLNRIGHPLAHIVANSLTETDDLLLVLDAVHFSQEDGRPYLAGYVAADWKTYAADWSTADRRALQAWFASPGARDGRDEVIDYIKTLLSDRPAGSGSYPYLVQDGMHQGGWGDGSRLRQ